MGTIGSRERCATHASSSRRLFLLRHTRPKCINTHWSRIPRTSILLCSTVIMSYQQGTIRTNFGSGGGPVRQKNTGTHWRFTRDGTTYVGRFEDSKESIDCVCLRLSRSVYSFHSRMVHRPATNSHSKTERRRPFAPGLTAHARLTMSRRRALHQPKPDKRGEHTDENIRE
ncbi:hypothetical protein BD626DRAFT_262363 [Schizophyllum amplum]|uniref:Uncharacterized protein n=1 Tax=Schizophyllum amplum TaxID=97359 RepID=A0A550CGF9_9AGAR|nr:hypothetical protein BD626DRAFT_262363 [Auriculariopsis ampla]